MHRRHHGGTDGVSPRRPDAASAGWTSRRRSTGEYVPGHTPVDSGELQRLHRARRRAPAMRALLACCSSIVSTPPAPTGPHGLQRAPVATMHTRIRIRRARCAGEAVRTPVPETARLTRDARQADSHGARTRLAPARARSRREHISSGCGRRFRGALRHAPRLLRPAPRRPAAALVSCSSPP
jgi:hypothetical protein